MGAASSPLLCAGVMCDLPHSPLQCFKVGAICLFHRRRNTGFQRAEVTCLANGDASVHTQVCPTQHSCSLHWVNSLD